MIKKDIPLYMFRFFTIGGHVFKCLSEFNSIYDLTDHLNDLEEKEKDFETCYITREGDIVQVMMKPGDICATESMPNIGPIVLQEHEKELQIHRTKILQSKQDSRKQIGQVARRK